MSSSRRTTGSKASSCATESAIAARTTSPEVGSDGRGSTNLRLSFSNVDDELIDTGIGRLARLVAATA
jgi:DNA-binding transcriptional MocR family regulator